MEPSTVDESAVNKPLTITAASERFSFASTGYGLLALALLYTLYFAKSLLMPIVVAMLFSLLLSPMVALFKRFYVPRTLSAILLLAMIGGPVTVLVINLAEPAQKWGAQLPELSSHLIDELDKLSSALSPDAVAGVDEGASASREKNSGWFSWFSDEAPVAVKEPDDNGSSALSDRVMQGGIEAMISILGATPVVIAQFMTFVILILFLLIFGPGLHDSYLKTFPSRQPVILIKKLQKELSRYIVTVTVINTGLGMFTAGVFWLMGVDDAILWGALVGVLNFAPYVGPIIALVMLCLAGVTQYGVGMFSLMPAAVFFGINLLEAQFITPTVLGRHMQLNPLVLIVWLLIWGWLWGPVGVLLAVPLLVCLKLAAAQLNILNKWVRLIETST